MEGFNKTSDIIGIKNDSHEIAKAISCLQKKIEDFTQKHTTQRMLGEVVKCGLDDCIIAEIESRNNSLQELVCVFETIEKYCEQAESCNACKVDTASVLAKSF